MTHEELDVLLAELASAHRRLSIAYGKERPTLYSRAGEAINDLLKQVKTQEPSNG
mgnify:CR=1 FL=1